MCTKLFLTRWHSTLLSVIILRTANHQETKYSHPLLFLQLQVRFAASLPQPLLSVYLECSAAPSSHLHYRLVINTASLRPSPTPVTVWWLILRRSALPRPPLLVLNFECAAPPSHLMSASVCWFTVVRAAHPSSAAPCYFVLRPLWRPPTPPPPICGVRHCVVFWGTDNCAQSEIYMFPSVLHRKTQAPAPRSNFSNNVWTRGQFRTF